MTTSSSGPILCFGEVLWDCLPAGLFLGGAPLNVAYHLAQLGRPSAIVSALGRDQLGDEAARRIHAWGIDDRCLLRSDRPTGTVQVSVTNGQPSYEILRDVAWDEIHASSALLEQARSASALIFGSLSQRSEVNRSSLQMLRCACQGRLVFDVNLRKPFDDLGRVRHLAVGVDLLKVNDDELAQLAPKRGSLETMARQLAESLSGPDICVTAGAKGAGLLRGEAWYWCPAQPIQIRDTVGAGDSYLAALLDGLLSDRDPEAVLQQARALAEHVAGCDGPTPAHPTPAA